MNNCFSINNNSGDYQRKTRTLRKMSILLVCFKLSRVNEQTRSLPLTCSVDKLHIPQAESVNECGVSPTHLPK